MDSALHSFWNNSLTTLRAAPLPHFAICLSGSQFILYLADEAGHLSVAAPDTFPAVVPWAFLKSCYGEHLRTPPEISRTWSAHEGIHLAAGKASSSAYEMLMWPSSSPSGCSRAPRASRRRETHLLCVLKRVRKWRSVPNSLNPRI